MRGEFREGRIGSARCVHSAAYIVSPVPQATLLFGASYEQIRIGFGRVWLRRRHHLFRCARAAVGSRAPGYTGPGAGNGCKGDNSENNRIRARTISRSQKGGNANVERSRVREVRKAVSRARHV